MQDEEVAKLNWEVEIEQVGFAAAPVKQTEVAL